MLTLSAGQVESLWDEVLPVEVQELPRARHGRRGSSRCPEKPNSAAAETRSRG
jgi:hypothetical protein